MQLNVYHAMISQNEKGETKPVEVIDYKVVKLEEKIEKVMIKSKEIRAIKKVVIHEKAAAIIIAEPEILITEPENQERIITDSMDFISPKIIVKFH